ncbi:prepilin-type N-terminal cleavage/methylation domain-containing protein [Candidatus Omnitrophota bacterium]
MKKSAFTLIEVIIVVLLISILACLSAPAYDRVVTTAKLAGMPVEIREIETYIQIAVIEGGNFATILAHLTFTFTPIIIAKVNILGIWA